jgi:hypothetical protein
VFEPLLPFNSSSDPVDTASGAFGEKGSFFSQANNKNSTAITVTILKDLYFMTTSY